MRSTSLRLVIIPTLAASVALVACNENRAGVADLDVADLDGNSDAGSGDTGLDGSGDDGGFDTGTDTGTDTSIDTGIDTSTDGTDDTGVDTGTDTVDPVVCGNGVVDEGELCDDGNTDDTDACGNDCAPVWDALCAPCETSEACAVGAGACVASFDADSACGTPCDAAACPDGFACQEVTTTEGEARALCVPADGACLPCIDADGDGFGIGPACAGIDCDDSDATAFPGAVDACDGVDNDCDALTADGDTDRRIGASCDGTDPDTCFSGATECIGGAVVCVEEAGATLEICDGLDNDCDPSTADGAAEPSLGAPCDDADADLCANGQLVCRGGGLVCTLDTDAPREVCNGADDDCNGLIDDGATDLTTWYVDGDRDGVGSGAGTVACVPPPGTSSRTGDCNDSDADIFPGAFETCDGRDENCDGLVDNIDAAGELVFADEDGDGYGDPSTANTFCETPAGWVTNGLDCDDTDAGINPDGAEICGDGADNDCSGGADCLDAVCSALEECADFACVSADLGSALGSSVASGSAPLSASAYRGTCAGNGPELAFTWTAPRAGTFIFTTTGSTYDTVLYARNGGCSATELGCNDDTPGAGTISTLSLTLAAGQTIVLYLDTFNGSGSSTARYVLNIDGTENCSNGTDDDGDGAVDCFDSSCAGNASCTSATCPDADLGSAVGDAVASGTLATADYTASGSCGGTGRDVAYTWTAPSAGRYTFSAAGSEFNPVLYTRTGTCTGAQSSCNAATAGSATTTLDLTAGQDVVIYVDSTGTAAGPFTLSIQARETGTAACGDMIDNDFDGGADCADLDCDLESPCCPSDAFEPNEGTPAAPSASFETYLTNPDAVLTLRPGDLDSFRITTCTGGTIRATANFTHVDGDINLRLRNATNTTLASSTSLTDSESLEYVIEAAPVGGVLFLQAYTAEGVSTCNDYTLDIELTGCAP